MQIWWEADYYLGGFQKLGQHERSNVLMKKAASAFFVGILVINSPGSNYQTYLSQKYVDRGDVVEYLEVTIFFWSKCSPWILSAE